MTSHSGAAVLAPTAPFGLPRRRTPVPDFDFVLFGATGDLAARKLLPALLQREAEQVLPSRGRIICTGQQPLSTEEFADRVLSGLKNPGDSALERFRARLCYVPVDARDPQGFTHLAELLTDPQTVRVFYLATAPALFAPICTNLAAAGLVSPHSRVVLEKPIGHDLDSSRVINDAVGSVFTEAQIYRIDHYLGKETVQNLMVLRFANPLFERPWSAADIDHVQITCSESLGVEGRGAYYDRAGALRDMVQNHLVQLLCLVAMEPPSAFDKDSVRDEKLKVLKAVRPITGERVRTTTVRAQYVAGAIDGAPVPDYLSDIGASTSDTETFVAIKAEIDNWRWSGVPFYLRTGKRLPSQSSEIIITFRQVRHCIFPADAGPIGPNQLVIRLQPDEGISQLTTMKAPGSGRLALIPASLQLSFRDTSGARIPEAYERLITDVIRGDATLFMRRDEVEASWHWIEPILDGWRTHMPRPQRYAAGSWGPVAAIGLIERDGRSWYETV
ncbi:NADP(+)-dependent glucose-6-phosphate dehydrogenase [Rhodovastum atsumiense]|uniref:Glucose-6-phosphate 1-dehydrogenase n=1 Tax=Rhodovastum atsumiense TaxID=504468 RepID=A0A5M6IS94_9PROT|nr:glucose-6-phosphate dehydrogenase [Rhodovastum atsumiense]KAA5611102.1 glucose-6-phosphate dehydrogenase [Rhodovastum atsumiense]CAH2599167.1 NADP(+)-dependent glucose-6-phosphate dehydrogenase [Rhodovastum atsumiense]